jgi:O-antigen/teichoic acid export membrane protein
MTELSTGLNRDRQDSPDAAMAGSSDEDLVSASLNQRVVSNTLVQLVSPALRIATGLILVAALARYLGVTGFGAYALVFAYVATFDGVFAEWGLGTVLLREISRRPEERSGLLASGAALQLIASSAAYLLMLVGLVFVGFPIAVQEAIALYGLIVFLEPAALLALPFQAELRLTRLLGPALAGVGLHFVLTMAVLLAGGSIVALAGAALLARLISDGWTLRLSLRLVTPTRPSVMHWRYFIGESWPLGIGTVMGTAIQQAPILFLSSTNLAAVGLYHAASRVPVQLALIPLILRTTTFPLLARSWIGNRVEFRRILDLLVSIALLAAVPVAILGAGLGPLLIRVLFGPEFGAAVVPFVLLLAGVGLLFPAILIAESLTAAGFQRINLVVLVVGLPTVVILLALLVPAGGATGAALAVVGTNALILTMTVALGRRRIGRDLPLRPLAHGLAAMAAGGTTAILLAPFGSPIATISASIIAALVLIGTTPGLPSGLRSTLGRAGRIHRQAPDGSHR